MLNGLNSIHSLESLSIKMNSKLRAFERCIGPRYLPLMYSGGGLCNTYTNRLIKILSSAFFELANNNSPRQSRLTNHHSNRHISILNQIAASQLSLIQPKLGLIHLASTVGKLEKETSDLLLGFQCSLKELNKILIDFQHLMWTLWFLSFQIRSIAPSLIAYTAFKIRENVALKKGWAFELDLKIVIVFLIFISCI